MTRLLPALALLAAAAGLNGCTSALTPGGPQAPITSRTESTEGRPGAPPALPEAPREWVDALCDRVEDCAVERNTLLAKESGGVETDVEAARQEAQQALVSGDVRAFCLLRVKRLGRGEVERIHGCLKTEQGCDGFYRCADFSGADARKGL